MRRLSGCKTRCEKKKGCVQADLLRVSGVKDLFVYVWCIVTLVTSDHSR